MIVEERVYVLHATSSPQDYLTIFRRDGLDIQRSTLGGLIGYYVSEVGELNAIVSLWQYETFEDRQKRRAKLATEPQWQEYLKLVRPMIRTMHNKLMSPVI